MNKTQEKINYPILIPWGLVFAIAKQRIPLNPSLCISLSTFLLIWSLADGLLSITNFKIIWGAPKNR